jgi:virulence-associated protein VapD
MTEEMNGDKRRKADRWYYLDVKTILAIIGIVFAAGGVYYTNAEKNKSQDCDITDMKQNIQLLTKLSTDMDKRISLAEQDSENIKDLFNDIKNEIRSLRNIR